MYVSSRLLQSQSPFGGFRKLGYPQSSSTCRWVVHSKPSIPAIPILGNLHFGIHPPESKRPTSAASRKKGRRCNSTWLTHGESSWPCRLTNHEIFHLQMVDSWIVETKPSEKYELVSWDYDSFPTECTNNPNVSTCFKPSTWNLLKMVEAIDTYWPNMLNTNFDWLDPHFTKYVAYMSSLHPNLSRFSRTFFSKSVDPNVVLQPMVSWKPSISRFFCLSVWYVFYIHICIHMNYIYNITL